MIDWTSSAGGDAFVRLPCDRWTELADDDRQEVLQATVRLHRRLVAALGGAADPRRDGAKRPTGPGAAWR